MLPRRAYLIVALAVVIPIVGFAASPAIAGQPPALVTLDATDITGTSATLHGTFNNEGGTGSGASFLYGLSTSYGGAVIASPPPSDATSGDQPISAAIVGLHPSTTYHFTLSGCTTFGCTQTSND